jgi:deazaflavin-dependent oxidoreductase (nitroreductase family)
MADFTRTSREERLVSQDDMGAAPQRGQTGPKAYLAPNWFARKAWNPVAMRFGIAGTETLTVQGRRSGRPHSVPVLPVEHGGARYIVAARGETDWVKNLRAAGGGQLGRRGRSQRFAADEIPVDRRAPVIDAYRAKGGRAVAGLFVKLPDPADHPVFRVGAEG